MRTIDVVGAFLASMLTACGSASPDGLYGDASVTPGPSDASLSSDGFLGGVGGSDASLPLGSPPGPSTGGAPPGTDTGPSTGGAPPGTDTGTCDDDGDDHKGKGKGKAKGDSGC